MSSLYSKYVPLAKKACEFLTASPDPFFVVKNCVTKLEKNGYKKLDGSSSAFTGQLIAGGKYYYIVEYSTIVAFAVGPKFIPSNSFGFHIIGGHTDSPNLKLKPRSKRNASGCTLLGVQCYGGGLWHTWFDRDLSVSGRVLVQQKPKDVDGRSYNTPQSRILKTEQRLVNLEDPIARISTLAIHLQTGEERGAFKVNKENHTSPIIATTTTTAPTPKIGLLVEPNDAAKTALEKEIDSQVNVTSSTTSSKWQEAQEPLLLKSIAEKLKIEVESIVDFELNLYDTQPASLGGITKEFLYSARLDNLATVFVALESLVNYTTAPSSEKEEKEEEKSDHSTFEDSSDVSVVVFFDHEEVGSNSAQGAGSPVMVDCISRISTALNGGATTNPDMHNACIRKSFVLSIDQAHALHPNYAAKHEATHAPLINGGIVVKTNSNQRYATNGVTGFVVRELGRICDIPVQEFVVRNDCPCGSTIGPEISAKTGIRVVDAGMPQLSMHSCREMMGIADLSHGVDMFTAFFNHFRSIDDNLSKDIV